MKPSSNPPVVSSGRSWRTIRQEVSSPAMSRRGRRRRQLAWLKVSGLVCLLGAGAWGVSALVHEWSTDRAGLAQAVRSEPVKEIALITDGVLTKKWVTDLLALPKGASLMALDLAALRDKFTPHGQVRHVVLTRSFPDTLVVNIQERTPVARIQASEGFGQTRQLLVARDGTVYTGLNYESQLMASLPWLDGVRLVKTKDGGFAPIAGMVDVSSLLSTAQLQAPHLYRSWMVVSLARLEAADEIEVKAQYVPRIVFSRKRDFFKQIAQLDYVIDATHALDDPQLQSVNLTLEGQVPVRLLATPDQLAAGMTPPSSLPTSQRKQQRDL
jgi:hypothetical protein